MFIVSDEVLERLICSQCKKYLSVYPVKVYPNRAIKCGRCSVPFDAGVISLFGLLANEALFRCVNRFEGCNQLLTYAEVAEHEKTCLGETYECQACIGAFKGTGYEILLHFKDKHTDRLLVNTSEFVLNVDNEHYKTYLYKNNDQLFFVNASYYRSEKEIILSVSYLGKDQDAAKISQMFTLLSVDEKVISKTKKKPCSSATGKNLNYFTVGVKKGDFVKNIVICKFEGTAEDMGNMLTLPRTFPTSLLFKFGSKANNNGEEQFGFNFSRSHNPLSKLKFSSASIRGFASINGFKHGRLSTFGDKSHTGYFGDSVIPLGFQKVATSTSDSKKAEADTIVTFHPLTGTDFDSRGEIEIATKFHSISLMEVYRDKEWSFEELRFKHYNTH